MNALLDILRGEFDFHVGEFVQMGENRWWANSTGWTWGTGTAGNSAAGVPVTHQTAMCSSAAMACTRALSETLATLPAHVMEQMDLAERQEARNNAMWALLHDQPNPRMDSVTWYGLNATRVINRGASINIIEFNGRGLPIALWPVHNSRFDVFFGASRQGPGNRWYPGEVIYRVFPDYTGRSYNVSADEVLAIVGWDTQDGVTGTGVVERMATEISLDLAGGEYAATMFKNGAIPLGVVSHPWLEDPDQRKELRNDLNSIHQGRENWNKIGLLWDKDAKWQNLNFNPRDVQAVETRLFSAKAICRGYNVPPAIVQIFDDYKFSTVESMLKHFVMLGIRPLAVRFEKAIKQQIFSKINNSDLLLQFMFEALLRGDPKMQAELNAIYRQWGILDGDEIRQRDLGLNPMPDGLGKVRLAPLNSAPLELIAAGEGLKAKQAKSGGNGNTSNADSQDDDALDSADTKLPRFDKTWLAALAGVATGMAHASGNGHTANGSGNHRSPPESAATAVAQTPSPPAPPKPTTIDRERATKTIRAAVYREVGAIRGRVDTLGHIGFIDWMESYYAGFAPWLAGNLANQDDETADGVATKLATAHIQESKEQLLKACEVSAEQFAASVYAVINLWPSRSPNWESLQ